MESRLVLETPRPAGEQVEAAARLESPAGVDRIWFRFPREWEAGVTPWADPFVIAFVFPMLERGGTVRVAGRVSPSLLANLERHMALWRAWSPERYRPLNLRADEEIESPSPVVAGKAAVAFSGGVDSCFTAWRHTRARETLGRRALPVAAGIVIHGMDITLGDPRGPARYAAALNGARRMLESLNLSCIPVTTNFRDVPTCSSHSHSTMLAAALGLFGGAFDAGVIPNTVGHRQLGTLWGSHPVLDPLLGSRNFPIFDDGVEATRPQKLALLARWPEAQRHLRVCFQGGEGDAGNCCRCEKCIRTILACRVAGIARPAALPLDITDGQIRGVRYHGEVMFGCWKELVGEIASRGLGDEPWARAMRVPMRRHARRQRWAEFSKPFIPLRNFVRRVVRGSPLSQRERAAIEPTTTMPPQPRSIPSPAGVSRE